MGACPSRVSTGSDFCLGLPPMHLGTGVLKMFMQTVQLAELETHEAFSLSSDRLSSLWHFIFHSVREKMGNTTSLHGDIKTFFFPLSLLFKFYHRRFSTISGQLWEISQV